jgi:AraC-type transcriptional regulator
MISFGRFTIVLWPLWLSKAGLPVSDFENQTIFPAAELFLIRRYMRIQGLSPQQWLLGTGLDEEAISRPDTLVSSHQFDIVYRNVYRLLERPDVGLHFGLSLNLSRWGMLAMALICARSLGAALETANAYRTLSRSRFNLHPKVEGQSVRITVTPRSQMTFPVNPSFAHEMLLGTLQSQISDLLGRPFRFQRIALPYPAPSHHAAYQRYCHCPVEFDAPTAVLWVSVEDMECSCGRVAGPGRV